MLPPEPLALPVEPDHVATDFTPAQREAADALRATVAQSGYSVTLIDGVTGSGKTQVYFEAVAEAVRHGRQVLILMPEIALTSQVLDRFAERFGVRPAEWHSQLSPRKRARTWQAVAAHEVSVIVGARSALFLPYAELGLIIVDEEHDPPTSRRTASVTMPATWRWCAATSPRFPCCSPPPRPRSRPRSMPGVPLPAPASAGALRRPAHAGD